MQASELAVPCPAETMEMPEAGRRCLPIVGSLQRAGLREAPRFMDQALQSRWLLASTTPAFAAQMA